MARKRRFRFGLPIVFAGRPSVGGLGLGCQPIRFAAEVALDGLGSILPDSALSDSKSPHRISGAGLILATMKICRCFARRVKLFDGEIAERRERLKQ